MSPRCRRPKSVSRISLAPGARNRHSGAIRKRRHVPQRPPEAAVMPWNEHLNTFLFGVYPYICLSVLLLGSLIRFDREPYTWKSDSSQILRRGRLRSGSNLFHYGVLTVVIGHFVGFLSPAWAVDWALSPAQHQLVAMVAGGIAGALAI